MKDSKFAYALIVMLLLLTGMLPVYGQFIRTHFLLSPGVKVLLLGEQDKIATKLPSDSGPTAYRTWIELRAMENLEIIIELDSQIEGNERNDVPLLVREGRRFEVPSKALTEKGIKLTQNNINHLPTDKGVHYSKAWLGIPLNTSGLILIHYP